MGALDTGSRPLQKMFAASWIGGICRLLMESLVFPLKIFFVDRKAPAGTLVGHRELVIFRKPAIFDKRSCFCWHPEQKGMVPHLAG